jgi:hypothetical protein
MEVRIERVFFSLLARPIFLRLRGEQIYLRRWQAANICLWVLAAALVDRIAVMGFNLIGLLVGSSSRQLLINWKRANNTV